MSGTAPPGELFSPGVAFHRIDPRSLRLVGSAPVGRWQLHGSIGLGFGDDAEEFEVELGFQRRFQVLGRGS